MKSRKTISLFLAMLIVISSFAGAHAFGINENTDDGEALKALYGYVDAMDTQNWEKYI
ncbi:MAG: hypothetical protein GX488_00935 [Clostridiales bacterium]|nr:hypothetical protein [Clostridiales bacterium]